MVNLGEDNKLNLLGFVNFKFAKFYLSKTSNKAWINASFGYTTEDKTEFKYIDLPYSFFGKKGFPSLEIAEKIKKGEALDEKEQTFYPLKGLGFVSKWRDKSGVVQEKIFFQTITN